MKRWRILLYSLLAFVGMAWLHQRAGSRARDSYTSEEPDREAIETQVIAMRDAVKRNDRSAIASLVIPELRQSVPSTSFFEAHVGTGPKMPAISDIRNNEATLTPELRRYFGIIPHGNTIGMKKIDGVWYFTKKLSID